MGPVRVKVIKAFCLNTKKNKQQQQMKKIREEDKKNNMKILARDFVYFRFFRNPKSSW